MKLIKRVPGDAYMYTDFTGATRHMPVMERTLDLRTAKGFRAGASVSMLRLKWTSEAGAGEALRGLKLSIRCYRAGQAKPAWISLGGLEGLSGSHVELDKPGCRGAIDQVDLRIEPDAEMAMYSRLQTIIISGQQK